MTERILINFPTNIGDTILSLPVLDRLKCAYPKSIVSVVASAHTSAFLSHNSFIDKVILFDKRWPLRRKIAFSFSLRGRFDIVVDLKNSFLPVLIGGRHTPFIRTFPKGLHAVKRNLRLLDQLCTVQHECSRSTFSLDDAQRSRLHALNLKPSIFIACASRHFSKTYPAQHLQTVLIALSKKYSLVILGSPADKQFYKDITLGSAVDLSGETSLTEVFYLLKEHALALLCVDSSILHIGSYLDIPLVALFGPTSPVRYGPWSKRWRVITRQDLACVPCEDPHCKFHSECMHIEPEKVIDAIESVLCDQD